MGGVGSLVTRRPAGWGVAAGPAALPSAGEGAGASVGGRGPATPHPACGALGEKPGSPPRAGRAGKGHLCDSVSPESGPEHSAAPTSRQRTCLAHGNIPQPERGEPVAGRGSEGPGARYAWRREPHADRQTPALPHVEHLKQPRVTETDTAAAVPSGTSEETQPVSQPRARPRVTWVLAVAWRGVACASPGPPPSPAAHGVAGRVCWPSRGRRRSACPSLVVPGHPASSVVKVPAKAVFKVTQALSHFYLYAKETLCCSLVFKITAFQIFAAKVNNLRFILSMIGKHLKPYLPNRLFLLTNYNQPWK